MRSNEEDRLKEEIEDIAIYLRQEVGGKAEREFRECMKRLQYKRYRVNPNFGDSFSAIVQQERFCKNCKKIIDSADEDIRNSFEVCVNKLIERYQNRNNL